jgi:hypothetical protein
MDQTENNLSTQETEEPKDGFLLIKLTGLTQEELAEATASLQLLGHQQDETGAWLMTPDELEAIQEGGLDDGIIALPEHF